MAATLEDLYAVSGKAELIDGEVIYMSPTGIRPGYAADEVYSSLRMFVKQTRTGFAIGDNKGFVVNLPKRKSFSPDAAFYDGPIPEGLKFAEKVPAFVVEVRSESDYGPQAEQAMAAKRADYFAAGTLVVWDVDLLSETPVSVYRASDPDHPTRYRRGEIAEAEPAVPGWSMPVDDLFLEAES